MGSWRDDRIGSALRGENPTVMARLPASFAVIGDVQWLPGYCVLLVDRHGVSSLTDLDAGDQQQFLTSLATLAGAVETACRASDPGFRRLNLEILGNTDASCTPTSGPATSGSRASGSRSPDPPIGGVASGPRRVHGQGARREGRLDAW